jgi:high affinity Mn2+ porin
MTKTSGPLAGASRGARSAMLGAAALLTGLFGDLAAPPHPAMAQGFGSPGIPNIGPPEAALFPDLAALQGRLEAQGWLLRGQATFILQGHPRFPSPYRGEASLSPASNARNTFSTDLVLGRRL